MNHGCDLPLCLWEQPEFCRVAKGGRQCHGGWSYSPGSAARRSVDARAAVHRHRMDAAKPGGHLMSRRCRWRRRERRTAARQTEWDSFFYAVVKSTLGDFYVLIFHKDEKWHKLGKKYVYHHKKNFLITRKKLKSKAFFTDLQKLTTNYFLSSHLLLFILLFYSIPVIQESIL